MQIKKKSKQKKTEQNIGPKGEDCVGRMWTSESKRTGFEYGMLHANHGYAG